MEINVEVSEHPHGCPLRLRALCVTAINRVSSAAWSPDIAAKAAQSYGGLSTSGASPSRTGYAEVSSIERGWDDALESAFWTITKRWSKAGYL